LREFLKKSLGWNRAQSKLHRIALKIYHDLVSQLNPIPKQAYMQTFNVLYRVLSQKRDDSKFEISKAFV